MNRSLIAAGVLAALGIGGVIGVAVFSPSASEAQSSSAPETAANDGWHGSDVHGDSWHADGDLKGKDAREGFDGSDAGLLALTRVTPAQAAAAAVAIVPGTAGAPDLHARDGALAYRVEVTSAAGIVEVHVDATTGVATIDLHRRDGK